MAEEKSAPLAELREVKKHYQLGKVTVPAVRGVTLEVTPGEFLALAGPSGSGKTTLLNLLGFLDTPTEGEVVLDGTVSNGLSAAELALLRRQKIGFVFQSFNLIPVLDAYENVELPLLLLDGWPVERRKEAIMQLLAEVGLQGMEHRRPGELSGGQQQRVAVARALVKNPAFVLADEPTANLDSKTGEGILQLMKQMNKEHGTTFIFSTHDKQVMDFADRLVNLLDGKIV